MPKTLTYNFYIYSGHQQHGRMSMPCAVKSKSFRQLSFPAHFIKIPCTEIIVMQVISIHICENSTQHITELIT